MGIVCLLDEKAASAKHAGSTVATASELLQYTLHYL